MASVWKITGPGAASLEFVDTSGTGTLKIDGTTVLDAGVDLSGLTATATELNYLDIATLGTGAASKAVVLDAGDDYTWPAAGVLTYGVLKDGPDATTITATGTEINNACDHSANVETVTAANVIAATESGKTFFLGGSDGFASTLPAAAAGLRFTFILATETAMSTTAHTIVAPSAILEGAIFSADATDIAVNGGTTLTFDDQATPTSLFGDRVDVICDGTKYYVTA